MNDYVSFIGMMIATGVIVTGVTAMAYYDAGLRNRLRRRRYRRKNL